MLRESESVYPLKVYYMVFGSFLDAVKKAGLKPRYKQEFDAVDRLRMLKKQLRAEPPAKAAAAIWR